MKRRALIIDDDKNFSESLTDILRKQNIDVKVVSSQLEMERSLDLEEYHLLIIDIILPKTNGIQLLRDVISKNLIHDGCHVWIVSGVLAKKAVPKDVMKHVNSFIKKPISLEDINKKVSELFSDQSILDIPFFYLENKKQDILNNNEHQIEGHELMFICFYLCSINFTGDLLINILDMKEEKIINFKEGKITHINYSDPHSYIGILLAKNHLVKKEDIKSLLEEKSDLSITERLLANCYISPHQLNKVLQCICAAWCSVKCMYQIVIRLEI